MKQTSVEWLIEQIESKGDAWENQSIRRLQISIDVSDYLDLKRQAKAMEKEQHEETALSIAEILLDKLEGKNDLPSKEAFEQYYNETYK